MALFQATNSPIAVRKDYRDSWLAVFVAMHHWTYVPERGSAGSAQPWTLRPARARETVQRCSMSDMPSLQGPGVTTIVSRSPTSIPSNVTLAGSSLRVTEIVGPMPSPPVARDFCAPERLVAKCREGGRKERRRCENRWRCHLFHRRGRLRDLGIRRLTLVRCLVARRKQRQTRPGQAGARRTTTLSYSPHRARIARP
jgi:hypothetical protein